MCGLPWLKCVIHDFKISFRWRSVSGMRKSRHSRRMVSPKRSHAEFALGARTGVRSTLTPKSVTTLPSSFEKMLSRSWMTNRYGWPPGRTSRNCCKVHSAVGCAVTL
jgi:hypothetical protein